MCPTCRGSLRPHCENVQCDWSWCASCKQYGDPLDPRRWRPRPGPPLPTK